MPKWLCPTCGSVKIASSRPRRDDIRRYCVSCSESTGRLVARTCPILDAKRERRAAERKDRTIEQRDRERQLKARTYTVDGIDVRDEFKRLTAIARDIAKERREFMPTPTLIVRRSATSDGTSGHVRYGDQRIVITIGKTCDRAEAVEVLAHEVAHLICPTSEHHGQKFHAALGEILERAYDIQSFAYRRSRQSDRDAAFVQLIRRTKWFDSYGLASAADNSRVQETT